MKKPYKQGLLDGMCGFYSIINSIHYLKADFTEKQAEKLLKNMVKTKPNTFHKLYLDGTYFENVIDLLKHVIQCERGFSDLEYTVPFEDDVFDDAYEYVACLDEQIDSKNKVAIFSVGEPWNHWTVATKIDTKQEKIRLFDSYFDVKDKGNKLSFGDLSIKQEKDKYHIYTYETIIISKK
jgi:hypothetical protein